MADAGRRTYRTREFAALAGVTPRALRHYDRLGLLKPQRTSAGYRAYSSRDLAKLEQIVALKFIGVPLRKIAHFAARSPQALGTALAAQRQVLDHKRQLLQRAILAIAEAERMLRAGRDADPQVYRRIIEVIEMQHDAQKWKETYERLITAKIDRLKSLLPEEAAALRGEWDELVRDVLAALDQDPAGPIAQALADRWLKRLERLMGAPLDPALMQMAAAFQSESPWGAVDKRVWHFMGKALAARPREPGA
jgi:DNA-binding transcriptional MerR regulator